MKSSFKMEDFHKYVKYAEYLRNGNHKRLQEYYEMQQRADKKKK
jgi:hypothetical protein